MARKDLKEPLPYYRWFWRDWRSNRKVQRMSWQAKALYRELLDEFWAEGPLPESMESLADICHCTAEEMSRYWPEISTHWASTSEGLVNHKMHEQRTEQDKQRVTRSCSGRLGALAKLVVADSEQMSAGAEHVPETENQSAASAEQALASAEQVPLGNEENQQLTQHVLADDKQVSAHAQHLPYSSSTSKSTSRSSSSAPEALSPEMVASAVMGDLILSGQYLLIALDGVCRAEMKAGRKPNELRDAMVTAWQDYDAAKPKLKYAKKPERFFGDGDWRNKAGWPWKDGCTPAPTASGERYWRQTA